MTRMHVLPFVFLATPLFGDHIQIAPQPPPILHWIDLRNLDGTGIRDDVNVYKAGMYAFIAHGQDFFDNVTAQSRVDDFDVLASRLLVREFVATNCCLPDRFLDVELDPNFTRQSILVGSASLHFPDRITGWFELPVDSLGWAIEASITSGEFQVFTNRPSFLVVPEPMLSPPWLPMFLGFLLRYRSNRRVYR